MKFIGNLLDQKITKADATKANQGIIDGVKDCRVGFTRVIDRSLRIHQWLDCVTHRCGQGNLDKNQRVIGKCWMEKSKTTTIRSKTTLQIVPASHWMNRLVMD